MSTMTVTVPQIVELIMVEDPTIFDTTTVTGSVSAGTQLNIALKDLIASPFGTWTYTSGTYSYTQTSAMSFDYPSGSGTIEGSSSTTLGFDLLYRPWGKDLSSMVRRTDSYTLVTPALKRLLSRVTDGDR